MGSADLRRLEGLKAQYGGDLASRKRVLLRRLARTRLSSAGAVARLHEALCFLRAYPDDAELLRQVVRMLGGFQRRADLRRHADTLEDSGIAGTPIVYCFFDEMAQWLLDRWPQQLSIEWDQVDQPERLERILHLLALYAETPALDEMALDLPDWLARLSGRRDTDAAFVLRRIRDLDLPGHVRESLYEGLGLFLRLSPGPGTPTRTHAFVPRGPITYQAGPLRRGRPDLCVEVRRPPVGVGEVSRREGRRLIDLARESMVTRSRDLDAFAYGDPSDVRVFDWGEGLELVAIGLVPERRLLLEAVYGFLTLKNGVPIGYVLNSALFGSAEIAYNVFDTFRGAEAAHVYGRVLATVAVLFGADSFTIYPYQLGGDGNDEGLQSGAWWFYQKLGFRPRGRARLGLMRSELQKMEARPGYRSSIKILERLAQENVYLHCGPRRDDVIGLLPLENVGLAAVSNLARRFGSDRKRAERVLSDEARERLGLATLRDLSPGQRLAFRRWAPLVSVLPGLGRFSSRQRRELGQVILAKGSRRESDYVRRFDAHTGLRAALCRLARTLGT
jgi:hypothetical protein